MNQIFTHHHHLESIVYIGVHYLYVYLLWVWITVQWHVSLYDILIYTSFFILHFFFCIFTFFPLWLLGITDLYTVFLLLPFLVIKVLKSESRVEVNRGYTEEKMGNYCLISIRFTLGWWIKFQNGGDSSTTM